MHFIFNVKQTNIEIIFSGKTPLDFVKYEYKIIFFGIK